MEVPTWHPANQDADARSKQSNATPRTEFKVMPGSTADTSTEAGRLLLSEVTDGGETVEGRGFFDISDRLYLEEQKQLDRLEKDMMRARDEAELQQFRSHVLKHQAHKGPLPPPLASSIDKTKNHLTSSVPLVIVKRKEKKRKRSTDCDTIDKQSKTLSSPTTSSSSSPRATVSSTPSTTTTVLGLGYSSD